MRLQAAMSDHRHAVNSLRDRVGIGKAFLGVAGYLLAGRTSAGADFRQFRFLNQVRQDLVFDLDLAHGIARGRLAGCGDRRDLRAPPLQFLARSIDNANRRDSGNGFRLADIDALDIAMRVRRGQQHAVQQLIGIQIRTVLRLAACFHHSVQAIEALAHHLAFVHWRPTIIRHGRLQSSIPVRPQERPCGFPYRCRNGRDCRRAPS